ncbi:hypothetical protein GCM10014713_17170 [Streptomyces purpureus]|uniref:Transposase n=1 Tax=Streptomyces purpureus TaxID=1951 RepID=A0A918LMB2_9ACTN|nr:hypothetical protein GCM10014713_17170 [Streptomyces purpureus]
MASQTRSNAGAKSEYLTYAPTGERCSNCDGPIGSLEQVHRDIVARIGAPPTVVYRHRENECPK